MKKNVLIIGAGGVAQVVAHKCAQHNDVLGDIHIASRTAAKCQAIIDSIHEKKNLKNPGVLEGHALDATDVDATAALIEKTGVKIVINVGSAFINMPVMSACIKTGVAYLDTAIHEEQDKICETPPGHPENPMSDSEIEAKFRRLSRHLMNADQMDRAITACWNIDQCEDLGAFTALFTV